MYKRSEAGHTSSSVVGLEETLIHGLGKTTYIVVQLHGTVQFVLRPQMLHQCIPGDSDVQVLAHLLSDEQRLLEAVRLEMLAHALGDLPRVSCQMLQLFLHDALDAVVSLLRFLLWVSRAQVEGSRCIVSCPAGLRSVLQLSSGVERAKTSDGSCGVHNLRGSTHAGGASQYIPRHG